MTTAGSLNGFSVDNRDRALLITRTQGNRHTATPLFHIFKAPDFEMTVTYTDAAGNVATVTAIAEFRQGRWPGRR